MNWSEIYEISNAQEAFTEFHYKIECIHDAAFPKSKIKSKYFFGGVIVWNSILKLNMNMEVSAITFKNNLKTALLANDLLLSPS